MIEYFKSDARLLSSLYEFEPGCWVNLVRPTSEEITHVLATTGVEEDFLRAALDPEESSRVELEEDQTLLIVDIPTLEESNVEQDESDLRHPAYGHHCPAQYGHYRVLAGHHPSAVSHRIRYATSTRPCAPDLSCRFCCASPVYSCATCV